MTLQAVAGVSGRLLAMAPYLGRDGYAVLGLEHLSISRRSPERPEVAQRISDRTGNAVPPEGIILIRR
jgi:hypothetical protein